MNIQTFLDQSAQTVAPTKTSFESSWITLNVHGILGSSLCIELFLELRILRHLGTE